MKHVTKGMINFGQSMPEASPSGLYRNEVERPELAAVAHPGPGQGAMPDMGCMAYKGQADSIALGQAGGPGCKQDMTRIHSQFKDYHWD
jgi:hypothetical protein